jgi:hypothetical protein
MDTKNWMLDEVKKTLNKGLSQEELINELTIQKMEYGRICMCQILLSGQTRQEIDKAFYELNTELASKISGLGGKPNDVNVKR